jgi:hypothetical protein
MISRHNHNVVLCKGPRKSAALVVLEDADEPEHRREMCRRYGAPVGNGGASRTPDPRPSGDRDPAIVVEE